MCRFAGYAGPPLPLSRLFYDHPHGLSSQAWQPREMLYGNVNVDGTGVAWWPPEGEGTDVDDGPLRYVTTAAPWNDANLPHLAPRLRARLAIGAVRSATPGIPFGPANVAPFVLDGLALSHNGFVLGFREGVGRRLLERVSDDAFDAMEAISDSLTLLLLVRDRVAAGERLPEAVAGMLATVEEVCRDTDRGATLNLLVADGTTLVAVRHSVELRQNSLYASHDVHPGGVTFASEPFTPEARFDEVATGSMVVVTDGEATTHLL